MPPTKRPENVLEDIIFNQRKMGRAITRLEDVRRMTVPIHDLTDLPPLVDGQVFIATDGSLNWVIDDVIRFTNGTAR